MSLARKRSARHLLGVAKSILSLLWPLYSLSALHLILLKKSLLALAEDRG
jgi:hypothetical protein